MKNSRDRFQEWDVAIAHKDYDVRGGGERVAEYLAETFDAPLIVGRRGIENEPESLDPEEIDYGPLPERIAKWAIDRGGATRSAAYQLVWQQQEKLASHDTVIMSGNEPLWYVPEDDQTIVAYTHSTPRWQYDLFHDVEGGLFPDIAAIGYNYLSRVLYQHNITRPDLYVANSDLVARRINQYWNIPEEQIRVVYPPVKTHAYSPDDAETQDFYLHLGRLAEHKRIDDLVSAFNKLNRGDEDFSLWIAGKGPDRDRLESLVKTDNIRFLGYVSEDRKIELMSAAKAHVYPALNEDFGMVPVESMAAGTPVIGVNEGFTQYQIMDGENGYTFERAGVGLQDTILEFERKGVSWEPEQIAAFADRFSVDSFRKGLQKAVAEAHQKSSVQPPWYSDETMPDSTIPSSGVDVDVSADGGSSL